MLLVRIATSLTCCRTLEYLLWCWGTTDSEEFMDMSLRSKQQNFHYSIIPADCRVTIWQFDVARWISLSL